ncbi:Na+/H+ antiporter NhaD/arsenite permease-like protein [Microvirga flocculans]|uniref:Na+/H+ antiporter NhaD/arsenite permease-like protein n=1 Tax=Microvirga flocculans TaxID=217168 RepID=A0A7W6IBX1_9HYPH|nr:sodium:proton antiporter [Microvirga flocculans]MBB4038652.1 Na+/H+ antiporter NhaD/arsenite permease-like protein [Microvirga flocculans]
MPRLSHLALTAALTLAPQVVLAAELDGASLGFVWALPFAGILLSIALFPLLAPHFWEHHQGKIAALWGLLVLIPMAVAAGPMAAVHALAHTAFLEYIPFILLLLALFTVAGGILVRGNIHGAPGTNTILLAIGTVLASFIGTTGASMVMIRPIMRANDDRRHNVHVIVFFIFLVSNIGGSLTPLGDPPLFLGFLRGVDFFWTTTHLFPETLFACSLLLALFFVIDMAIYRREGRMRPDPTPDNPVRLVGGVNFLLILAIIGAILMSATVDLGRVTVLGTEIELANALRDLIMIAVTVLSLAMTPKANRAENGFSWGPIKEVAKLFAGIFIAIIPVLAMLKAGADGAFAPLVALVSNPDGSANNAAYFWLTGGLSSFLDNAPTYLVFFELAGGDPQQLMTGGALTLAAISAGAVFMGANSYIGNAPNFMVYAIAREGGVKMPSFFGYLLWSGGILIPTFLLVTLLFFRG